MKAISQFIGSALHIHWIRFVYIGFIIAFCFIPASVFPASRMQLVFMGAALVLLPFSLLTSRLSDPREVAEGAFDILVEVLVAIATSFLLVGVQELTTHPNMPFAEKVGEITVVFILVFAVQIVSKSTKVFAPAIANMKVEAGRIESSSAQVAAAAGELTTLSEKLDGVAQGLQASGEQIKQAQYVSLAARVLGIRNRDRLMIPGVSANRLKADEALAPIVERALDSLQAWIQTGFSIENGEAGALGRQTWWRLMEAYHREEVFDVPQLELATNVRSFAMMLLLTIGYHLNELQKDERLVVVNVSKFPPKDFYDFPDGSADKRFYHEPEFFGTYRRALGAITKHPKICPMRIFLCGPGDDIYPPDTMAIATSPIRGYNGAAGAAAVGMDTATKIAYDCAFLNFLPVPLTFSAPAGASSPPDDTLPRTVAFFKDRCARILARLPKGVTRVLITPYFRWLVEPQMLDEADWIYRNNHANRDELSGAGSEFDRFHDEAAQILELALAGDASNPAGGREFANFKGQLDEAWGDLARRCIGFGWDDAIPSGGLFPFIRDAAEALKESLETSVAPPGGLAARLHGSVKDYEQQYWQYLEEARNAHDEYSRCVALTERMFGRATPEREERFGADQQELVALQLSLVSRCQMIDSLDRYLELVTARRSAPEPKTGSTGIKLGYAENWLHRMLISFEARSILEEVKKYGPIPLWKLVASDLCGLREASGDIADQFETFLSEVSNRIRLYDPSNDTEKLFNEFMLVGTAKCTEQTLADCGDAAFRAEVSDVRWKALIGTHINEPFHTCRIQFDFDDYHPKTFHAAGQSPAPSAAAGPLGTALRDHVKWLIDVMGRETATEQFKTHLAHTWQQRTAPRRAG